MSRAPLGLYLHIPFCRQRCDFCAFYLEIYRHGLAGRFVDSLRREIRLYGTQTVAASSVIQSIYFGGGTPTTLLPDQLHEILTEIRQRFMFTPDVEITIEAHPGTVSEQNLAQLTKDGFTRISFGAESMDDRDFVSIGRAGGVHQTVQAVAMARAAGFANINLDMMYGLPGQTLDSWRRSLDRIIQLGPAHISCYALTVEAATQLAVDVERHAVAIADDELQIAMDGAAHTSLERAGYQRYEISNYAMPGYACRHNLLYWTNGSYLGLGPSAQSYVGGRRFGNVADLTEYDRALGEDRLPVEASTDLTASEQLRDAVIFGLRLVQGIPTEELEKHALHYGHRETLMGLRTHSLIEEDGKRSKLTVKGRQYADTVAEKLY